VCIFQRKGAKNKKHRPQTVLYLNAKSTQTPLILGFCFVSKIEYWFGGGEGNRTPVRRCTHESFYERIPWFWFRFAKLPRAGSFAKPAPRFLLLHRGDKGE